MSSRCATTVALPIAIPCALWTAFRATLQASAKSGQFLRASQTIWTLSLPNGTTAEHLRRTTRETRRLSCDHEDAIAATTSC